MNAEIQEAKNYEGQYKILVSLGTCGIAAGTRPVLDAIKKELINYNLESDVEIVEVGCMGLCHSEPTIELVGKSEEKNIIYGNVQVDQVPQIIRKGLDGALGIKTIKKNWYYPEDEKNTDNHLQARIVLRNSGRINPEKIDEYIKMSGYVALKKFFWK